jgi:hypothetical protein
MGGKPHPKEYTVVFDNEARMPLHPFLQGLLGGDAEAAARFFPEEEFNDHYRSKSDDLVDVVGTAADMEQIRQKLLARMD